jgi:hypothetical protein
LAELQALNANMQLLQSRISKMSSGKSEEGVVRSKVWHAAWIYTGPVLLHTPGRLLPPLVTLPVTVT